jgi:hypothetical protein
MSGNLICPKWPQSDFAHNLAALRNRQIGKVLRWQLRFGDGLNWQHQAA